MLSRRLFLFIQIFITLNYYVFKVKYRYGADSIQPPINNNFRSKSIPFEFTVKIPPPLRRGVDYGFKKEVNGNLGIDVGSTNIIEK